VSRASDFNTEHYRERSGHRDGRIKRDDPREESEIERVIVAAIEKHARGDVEALARGIIEELRFAGLAIRRMDAIPIRNPGC
jgi:hypothetical protein